MKRICIIASTVVVFFMLGVAGILFVVTFSTERFIYADITLVPATDAALIPGAAILKNGKVSPVLRDRVVAAITLYKAGKVKKIIASGDNSKLEYNEVQPIRAYLLANDIPSEDIFVDYAGFDTYSSLYRARDVFLVSSITIVSQSFHLPRAVFIGRGLGVDAYGMIADNGHYKQSNYFREMLADVKAALNLLFGRSPKFLGDEIPITGSGEQSLP